MKRTKNKKELIKPRTIYLNDIEYIELKNLANETTSKTISNFLRTLILNYKNGKRTDI